MPYGAPYDGIYRDGPGFTKHATDEIGSLSYMQERYYDPNARFISPDPVEVRWDSFNRYAYASNNPYTFTDPDGRDPMRAYAYRQYAQDIGSRMWASVDSGLFHTAGQAIAADAAFIVGVATDNQALQDFAVEGMRENITGDDGVSAAAMLLAPRGGRAPSSNATRAGTSLVRVGDRLASVNDVLANPSLLRGLNPAQVNMQLGQVPAGWRTETLGQGAHRGQGYVLREYLPNGEASGRMMRWHPGGGHHGPNPYWTVTQPNVPTVRIPGGN